MAPVVNRWRKLAEHKLNWLPFNKSVISDFSNFISMNTSQSEELRYFVFITEQRFFIENKPKVTIDLPRMFGGNCGLGLLEKVFQDSKILRFSGGACPRLPSLVKIRFGKVYGLDSQTTSYHNGIVTVQLLQPAWTCRA